MAESTEYKNLPVGEYEGRLVYVADLGMQEGMVWKGDKKPNAPQIALGIEILGQVHEYEGEEYPLIMWDNPFNVFSNLTELGKELKRLKVFDPSAKEGDESNWADQLGKPVNVNLVHNKGKGANVGKTFDNIGSLSPIPAKYQADVADALTTDMCIGDEADEDSPAQKHMFGLVRWVFDRRLADVETPKKEQPVDDDDAFDD